MQFYDKILGILYKLFDYFCGMKTSHFSISYRLFPYLHVWLEASMCANGLNVLNIKYSYILYFYGVAIKLKFGFQGCFVFAVWQPLKVSPALSFNALIIPILRDCVYNHLPLLFKPSGKTIFTDQGGATLVDRFCYLCFVFVMRSWLFIAALWLTAGKGLAS